MIQSNAKDTSCGRKKVHEIDNAALVDITSRLIPHGG